MFCLRTGALPQVLKHIASLDQLEVRNQLHILPEFVFHPHSVKHVSHRSALPLYYQTAHSQRMWKCIYREVYF